MSTISLRLPISLHRSARRLAHREHVSMNHIITLALAEKVSSLMTVDYLEQRSRKASRRAFERAMKMVPSTEPDAQDRLSPSLPTASARRRKGR